ncbi:MAG TPA: gamma-glutamyltransferase family protein [Polyangiaceae bacterium]|nr:gamma-glutamyltransferase family protein [Polyangiaceae bacterium]
MRLHRRSSNLASSTLGVAALTALCAAGVRMHALGGKKANAPAPYRERYAVATENATATRVGIEALRAGANAVDTAIAVALTLGVVQPASSGIGGGGFALVWDASQRKVTALDFREVAPGTIDPALLEYRSKTSVATGRGRMIGVPGEVAGLAELHRRFGRRSFAEDAAPAAAIAEGGYYTSDHLARLALAYHAQLNWSDPLRTLFKPDGYAASVGRRIANAPLAATLRRIGAEGPKAFYEGHVAMEMVKASADAGGFLSTQDLRAYRPVEREPLKVNWEGHTVYTMPPPSAGGLLLAETLGTFGKADLEPFQLGSGAYNHLLAETFRGAIADRMHAIGDPAFVDTNVSALMERVRLLDRRAQIALDRSRPPQKFFLQEHGTTHFVVVDAEGNVVSLTTTINDAFGAFVGTETTGVILNDELDDFTTKAASTLYSTGKGVTASRVPEASSTAAGPNEPRAFARPTSSMTPTIAFRDGLPVLALGGSGGLRIATGVTEAFLARTVFQRSAADCVSMTRFHTPVDDAPSGGPVLELDESSSDELVQDLKRRGEVVRTTPNYSAVQMVTIERGPHGAVRLSAASDPRKGGTALVE